MLDTYRRLEAVGAIGRMMKVGSDGKTPIYDPSGEQPGTLVPRPFAEYPKMVRRVKIDAEGKEHVLSFCAHSKSEELKIMSDTAELNVALSPLERERDDLAKELATSNAMNGKLASQLETALARLSELSNTVEKMQIAQTQASETAAKAEKVSKVVSAAGVEALALANKRQ